MSKQPQWSDERIDSEIRRFVQHNERLGYFVPFNHVQVLLKHIRDDLQAALERRTKTAYRLLACNAELQERIAELEAENARLRTQLDSGARDGWIDADKQLPPLEPDGTSIEVIIQTAAFVGAHGDWIITTDPIFWCHLPAAPGRGE